MKKSKISIIVLTVHMEWMSNELPNGSLLLCKKGSHMAMWDDADTYANGIIKFLLSN